MRSTRCWGSSCTATTRVVGTRPARPTNGSRAASPPVRSTASPWGSRTSWLPRARPQRRLGGGDRGRPGRRPAAARRRDRAREAHHDGVRPRRARPRQAVSGAPQRLEPRALRRRFQLGLWQRRRVRDGAGRARLGHRGQHPDAGRVQRRHRSQPVPSQPSVATPSTTSVRWCAPHGTARCCCQCWPGTIQPTRMRRRPSRATIWAASRCTASPAARPALLPTATPPATTRAAGLARKTPSGARAPGRPGVPVRRVQRRHHAGRVQTGDLRQRRCAEMSHRRGDQVGRLQQRVHFRLCDAPDPHGLLVVRRGGRP